MSYHIPVLLHEAIEALNIVPGGRYIDGTLGGGGYTLEIAKRGGEVLSFDVDEDAIKHAHGRMDNEESWAKNHVHLVKANFRQMREVAQEKGFVGIQGVVADLGVSSHQFDEGLRGFSFRNVGPLDMRMDQSLEKSAKDLVNTLTSGELCAIFLGFGQERMAKRMADKIVQVREVKPIETTQELADIAASVYPKGFHKIHPATRMFQALRIAVNDELGALKDMLPQAVDLLASGGRLVVVSFHSMEDEIVKEEMVRLMDEGKGKMITKKVVEPTEEEIESNPKSRSAKMRIFEKI